MRGRTGDPSGARRGAERGMDGNAAPDDEQGRIRPPVRRAPLDAAVGVPRLAPDAAAAAGRFTERSSSTSDRLRSRPRHCACAARRLPPLRGDMVGVHTARRRWTPSRRRTRAARCSRRGRGRIELHRPNCPWAMVAIGDQAWLVLRDGGALEPRDTPTAATSYLTWSRADARVCSSVHAGWYGEVPCSTRRARASLGLRRSGTETVLSG